MAPFAQEAKAKPGSGQRRALYGSALTVSRSAGRYHVPQGLLWGTLLLVPARAGQSLEAAGDEIAAHMAAVHHKTGRWDVAVSEASGGRVTDAQATNANHRLDINRMLDERVIETKDIALAIVFAAAGGWVVAGAPLAAGAGGAAAAGTTAAGTGAAAAGGADAAAAGGGAAAGSGAAGVASSALSGVTSKLLAGGLVAALVAAVSGYGLRLLEILAGAILVLFGLATLAKGGQTPDLPKAIPV